MISLVFFVSFQVPAKQTYSRCDGDIQHAEQGEEDTNY